jgi:hypothetical protein
MNDDVSGESAVPARGTKPSLAPSWFMLGIVLGALFMWALPRHESSPPVMTESPAVSVREPASPPRLTVIEDVFAEWSRYAVWENDLTEVALWNSGKKSFSDYYEVLRSGENYYIRTLPRLTRPILIHGVNPNSPLQFTETQAQLEEWRRDRNQLTFRALSEAAQQNIPAPGAKAGDSRK